MQSALGIAFLKSRSASALVEGSGTGEGRGLTPGQAHEIALKSAETDATKRGPSTPGTPRANGNSFTWTIALYEQRPPISLIMALSQPSLKPASITLDRILRPLLIEDHLNSGGIDRAESGLNGLKLVENSRILSAREGFSVLAVTHGLSL